MRKAMLASETWQQNTRETKTRAKLESSIANKLNLNLRIIPKIHLKHLNWGADHRSNCSNESLFKQFCGVAHVVIIHKMI
jgi:lipid II:glycine glycyltransferase (peptidoglycan interpeptide bridge formation enzyme)